MLLLILCLNIAQSASALPEEAMFGVEQDSVEWKRAELEEFIVLRTTRDLLPFVRQDLFRVQAQVTFKEATNTHRPSTNVNIPLLGTVAMLVPSERSRPQQGIFNKIARIDLTLIVSEEVPQATVDSMTKLMLQKVPVISKDKVFLEVVRLQVSGLGLAGWIREFKGLITVLCMVVLFLIALYFTLPRLRFQTYVKVGPVPRQDIAPAAGILPGFTNLQQTVIVPSGAGEGEDLSKSVLPQTINAVELKRLRSAAVTLSIADCIDLIKTDSRLGSILVSLLPPDKATRVVGQLPYGLRKELTMKTLEWTAESLIKNSEALMAAMQKFRGSAHLSKAQTERLGVFVDQVGPENEEAVFAELIRMKKFEELKLAVKQSPPASLIPYFPMEILGAAFERLSFHERACLIATCDSHLADRLCPSKSRDPMHLSLKTEVEHINKDPMAMAEASSVWPRFVVIVREALHKNSKFQSSVAPHVNDWLWHRSNGVVGVANSGGKTKKSDDAA